MTYKKILTITFLVFICAPFCAAQDAKCSATLTGLPQAEELRGFHLGMTLEQVKARIPKLQLGLVNEFGVAKTSVNPDFNADVDKATFQGVRTISLDFLDNRLYSLAIAYNGAFKWQRLDEFLPQISKALHLPASWQSRSWHGQELDCADFQANIRMIGESPSLTLVDKKALQTIEQRTAAKEETEP